eukprot:scaffold96_cov302-Prasinococcus_capsulatus_cf.AAC.8
MYSLRNSLLCGGIASAAASRAVSGKRSPSPREHDEQASAWSGAIPVHELHLVLHQAPAAEQPHDVEHAAERERGVQDVDHPELVPQRRRRSLVRRAKPPRPHRVLGPRELRVNVQDHVPSATPTTSMDSAQGRRAGPRRTPRAPPPPPSAPPGRTVASARGRAGAQTRDGPPRARCGGPTGQCLGRR